MGTNSSKVFYIQPDQRHAQESDDDNDSIPYEGLYKWLSEM